MFAGSQSLESAGVQPAETAGRRGMPAAVCAHCCPANTAARPSVFALPVLSLLGACVLTLFVLARA